MLYIYKLYKTFILARIDMETGLVKRTCCS